MKMRKLILAQLMLLIILLPTFSTLMPAHMPSPALGESFDSYATSLTPSNPAYERGPNFERWSYLDGRRIWKSAPPWVLGKFPSMGFVPYIFEDHYKDQNYNLIQNGLIGLEIYSTHIRIFDPDHTDLRVAREQWIVEMAAGPNWLELPITQAIAPSSSAVTNSSGAFVTLTYPHALAILTITYAVREGLPLEHFVQLESKDNGPKEFRVIQRWTGIAADQVISQQGTTLGPATVDSPWFRFARANNSYVVFEDQSAMYYQRGTFAKATNHNMKAAVIGKASDGLTADFIFGNWTLASGESLTIDPDTQTKDSTTISNDSTVGVRAWVDLDNGLTSNDLYTRSEIYGGESTNYLKAKGFGFAIPSDATIDGILVEVERKAQYANLLQDNSVKIVKNDVISGAEKADTATYWPLTDAYKAYGGSSDLWGLAWTPADINSYNFGFVISAKNTDTDPTFGRIVYIDYVRMTIYYNTTSPSTPIPFNGIFADVLLASANTVYFVVGDYSDAEHTAAPKCQSRRAASSTDASAAAYPYALDAESQFTVLDTNGAVISQAGSSCGRPLVSNTVVAIAGHLVNEVVYWYEYLDGSSPLWVQCGNTECTIYDVIRRDTGQVVYHQDGVSPVYDGFLLQAFMDSAGRHVFLIHGLDWDGTLAAGLYVAHVIAKNSAAYTASWYVLKWQDAPSGPSANFLPDDGDTFTQIAAGPSGAGVKIQIQDAINLGYQALLRLYKGDNALGSSWSAQDEYMGFPLSLYNSYYGRAIRAGEGTHTSIGVNSVTATSEDFEYEFWNIPPDTIQVKIGVHLDFSPKQIRVIFRNDFHGLPNPSSIYLYGNLITSSFGPSNVGASVTKFYNPQTDSGLFRSFRYTIRHGSQMGSKLYHDMGDAMKASQLVNPVGYYGFTYDIYDGLFDPSLWQMPHSYFYFYNIQAYHDCDVNPSLPDTPTSYPYHSKVCLWRDGYITASAADVLVPTLQAIYVLRDSGPDYHYQAWQCGASGCWFVDRTPRGWARYMETLWNGEGIPKPGATTYGTSVRTAAFGVLETILGYSYGDSTSKTWADTVRDVLLKVQVNALGYYPSGDLNGIALRPLFAGMWFTAWDPYMQAVPRSLYDTLLDWLGMPLEYAGMVPGNMESTESILQFFNVYLALAFP